MLAKAKNKIKERNWQNIELVHCDASAFRILMNIDGILSTFLLVFIKKYETIFKRASCGLKTSKHLVIFDQKLPVSLFRFFIPLFAGVVKPFSVTQEIFDRRPWKKLSVYFHLALFQELYFCFCYLVVGEKHLTIT